MMKPAIVRGKELTGYAQQYDRILTIRMRHCDTHKYYGNDLFDCDNCKHKDQDLPVFKVCAGLDEQLAELKNIINNI
jgi:hypothetical protein